MQGIAFGTVKLQGCVGVCVCDYVAGYVCVCLCYYVAGFVCACYYAGLKCQYFFSNPATVKL